MRVPKHTRRDILDEVVKGLMDKNQNKVLPHHYSNKKFGKPKTKPKPKPQKAPVSLSLPKTRGGTHKTKTEMGANSIRSLRLRLFSAAQNKTQHRRATDIPKSPDDSKKNTTH